MSPVISALIGGLSAGAWIMGFVSSVLIGLLLIVLGILGCIGIYDELSAIYKKRQEKAAFAKHAQSKEFKPTFVKSTDDET